MLLIGGNAMKRSFLMILVLPVLAVGAPCKYPYVFFDLGNTLVDTETYHYKKMYYEPGAYAHVKQLRANGVHQGLLINYPDSTGANEAAKIADLKIFLQAGWWLPTPDAPKTFDWTDYDLGVYVPDHDSNSKPKPYLFNIAIALAKQAGCPVIFEGDDPDELAQAGRLGMFPRDVPRDGFLPVDELNAFAEQD